MLSVVPDAIENFMAQRSNLIALNWWNALRPTSFSHTLLIIAGDLSECKQLLGIAAPLAQFHILLMR